MHPSRRTFLKTASLAAASLPLASVITLPADAAGADSSSSPTPTRKGPGPGLLFDARDLPRLRRNAADPRFADYWKTITSADVADDTDFIRHRARYNRHSDDMQRVRFILERSALLTFITEDPRQLALARLALRKILDYPKWDMFLEGGTEPIGILRAAEACIALAFTLDWLAGHLSADERAEVERQIAEKGAPACANTLCGMKYPERVKGWTFDPEEDYPILNRTSLARWPLILNSTNLKAVPAAGLGIAACLLHGRHPQADAWLELARSSMFQFTTMYGSDGSYDEGISYWVPTTLDVAVFAEVLWRTLKIDDRSLINYPGTIRYGLSMTLPRKDGAAAPLAPRYDIVNFGDANGSVEISLAAWVARNRGDAACQYLARDLGEAKYHYGLLWFDRDAPCAQPEPALLDHRMLNDLVISRSGWGEGDSVVALRSGGPANHEHADRNSVIFKAHGDRLFHDPFEAAYSCYMERWKLRLTTAHTAVLINGQGHTYIDGREGTNASRAWAHVTAFNSGPGWMTVTSDVTEAYQLVNSSVSRVQRTLVFLKPDILLLFDQVDLSAAPATVQVRFQVYNEDKRGTCSASGDGFGIDRPWAGLRARVGGASPFTVATGQVDIAASEGVFPFAEVSSSSGHHHALLTACTAAPAGEPHGDLAVSYRDGAWRVEGSHRGRKVHAVLTAPEGCPPVVSL